MATTRDTARLVFYLEQSGMTFFRQKQPADHVETYRGVPISELPPIPAMLDKAKALETLRLWDGAIAERRGGG